MLPRAWPSWDMGNRWVYFLEWLHPREEQFQKETRILSPSCLVKEQGALWH